MQISWSRRPGPFILLDALALTGAVGFLLARFVPVAQWVPFWGCPLRRATGIPCPGCGLTRAAERLAHFQLGRALDANPLGALLGIFFALCVIWAVVQRVFDAPLPNLTLGPTEARRARLALFVALGLNYAWALARNVGWFS